MTGKKYTPPFRIFQRPSKRTNFGWNGTNRFGNWIEKDEIIAKIYEYNKTTDLKNAATLHAGRSNNNYNNQDMENKLISDKSFEQRIISYIDISKDRDINKDPTYGIELLRSLAVKSINSSDTDVVNSCITGLFSTLKAILKSKEFLGIPFTLEPQMAQKTSIIIHLKELRLSDLILLELSIILEKAVLKQQQITVTIHFVNEYVSTSKYLLENNKIDDFERLTSWFADIIIISFESFQKQFQLELISPVIELKKDLVIKYPHQIDSFVFYMQKVFDRYKEIEN